LDYRPYGSHASDEVQLFFPVEKTQLRIAEYKTVCRIQNRSGTIKVPWIIQMDRDQSHHNPVHGDTYRVIDK